MATTTDPFAAFVKALSSADDALQDDRRDTQHHLEQLVGAGWKLLDHMDAARSPDVDSLAAAIRQVAPELAADVLAPKIYDEWPLVLNYERVVAAAKTLSAHPDVRPDAEVVREMNAALAPFMEG
jgi:hypothetical protein